MIPLISHEEPIFVCIILTYFNSKYLPIFSLITFQFILSGIRSRIEDSHLSLSFYSLVSSVYVTFLFTKKYFLKSSPFTSDS